MSTPGLVIIMRQRAESDERMAVPADWQPTRGRHAAIPCDRSEAWDAYRRYATQASIPAPGGQPR